MEMTIELTWNRSLASFATSARMVLTSRGVKLVPPPLGKSTSSVRRLEVGCSGFSACDLLGLWSTLLFFALGAEVSSRARFVPATMLSGLAITSGLSWVQEVGVQRKQEERVSELDVLPSKQRFSKNFVDAQSSYNLDLDPDR